MRGGRGGGVLAGGIDRIASNAVLHAAAETRRCQVKVSNQAVVAGI